MTTPRITSLFGSSPSAFVDVMARLVRVAPQELAGESLLATWFPTPIGDMVAVASPAELHLLEFGDRRALGTELRKLHALAPGGLGLGEQPPITSIRAELDDYFAGRSTAFATPTAWHGSAFTREVWHALQKIPSGTTETYGGLADHLGRPTASRAVARANGANQLAIVIPCHRVIGADGSLTGYGGGLWRKRWLLDHEAAIAGALTLFD